MVGGSSSWVFEPWSKLLIKGVIQGFYSVLSKGIHRLYIKNLDHGSYVVYIGDGISWDIPCLPNS